MSFNRRDMMGLATLMAGLGLGASAQAQDVAVGDGHEEMMAAIPELKLMGSERIAMLVYPQFTALDIIGPQYFFSQLMGARVDLVTTEDTLEPLMTDTRVAITPTKRLADIKPDLDVVFVPGGTTGTLRIMEMPTVLNFLKACSEKSRYVTSTCTGSLVLGAAGLLKGKRCTSYWGVRDTLEAFGGIPVNRRVVMDGKFVTGAGVSAGIDMAITMTRLLRGDPYAQGLMLMAEYAPDPPMPGGTPETTEPRMRKMITDMIAPMDVKARAIAKKSGV